MRTSTYAKYNILRVMNWTVDNSVTTDDKFDRILHYAKMYLEAIKQEKKYRKKDNNNSSSN